MHPDYPFHHPLKPEDITEENHREVADDLFRHQLHENIRYSSQVLEYGWSDDDTDYMRSNLTATEHLMDLAYDLSREDLIHFLFGPQDASGRGWTLADINSAGGFCLQLQRYATLGDLES